MTSIDAIEQPMQIRHRRRTQATSFLDTDNAELWQRRAGVVPPEFCLLPRYRTRPVCVIYIHTTYVDKDHITEDRIHARLTTADATQASPASTAAVPMPAAHSALAVLRQTLSDYVKLCKFGHACFLTCVSDMCHNCNCVSWHEQAGMSENMPCVTG